MSDHSEHAVLHTGIPILLPRRERAIIVIQVVFDDRMEVKKAPDDKMRTTRCLVRVRIT